MIDCTCPNPKFIRDKKQEQYLTKFHPESQIMIQADPKKFLKVVNIKTKDPLDPPEEQFPYNEESAEKLKERMCNRQPIDPLFLDYDIDKEKITAHEGRHRALMAMRCGIKKVPVIVYWKKEVPLESPGIFKTRTIYAETKDVLPEDIEKIKKSLE